ncbi:MAG: inorganic diphosphatase [bacterium]
MGLNKVSPGANLPEEVNVIIEIPAHSDPIKYEVDKDSGALFVDRFMSTAMHYPCNYGYIPHTLSDDGDPVDVLVITPFPVQAGCVISCRVIAVLNMEDESGHDEKLLAVPIPSVTRCYEDVTTLEDLPPQLSAQIAHFFEHYKDIEKSKWTKIEGWGNREEALKAITDGVERYNKSPEKPEF